MPDNPDYGERTEPASPRKREEARRKGQVSRSQEVNYAVVLLASVLGLYLLSRYMIDGACQTIIRYLSDPLSFDLSRRGTIALLINVSWDIFRLFLPFAFLLMFVGVGVNLLQVGFLMTTEPLIPKWDRINPMSGFGRLFSWRGLAELIKALAKVSLISWVCYVTVKSEIGRFFTASYASTAGTILIFGDVLYLMSIRCALIILVVALLDFAFQRWQYEKSLRMSVQELKEEMKETFGDPMIKARVRQIQRQMAQQRMMGKVPEAEVVVTNPTHYAVALAYEGMRMDAPTVVAKGKGYIALRIREIAEKHGVPIVEDPDLARALYNSVDLDMQIPEMLYQAVARVLAYVYNLRKKTQPSYGPPGRLPATAG